MNILKREWHSYTKETLYWIIGMLALLGISFYKMQGLAVMPGGVEAFLDTLPSFFQTIFGINGDMNNALGIYRIIHLYMVIALALHAVQLGAQIFSKEERDKTYEFLYVKGVKRSTIILIKILAGISILFVLDIVVFLGVCIASMIVDMQLSLLDLHPYISSLFMAQLFFFTLAMLISLILVNNQKAGMLGSSIVMMMFLVSMYAKLGGDIAWLEQFSIFHYTDASFIQSHPEFSFPIIIIFLCTFGFGICAIYAHEKRDLLG